MKRVMCFVLAVVLICGMVLTSISADEEQEPKVVYVDSHSGMDYIEDPTIAELKAEFLAVVPEGYFERDWETVELFEVEPSYSPPYAPGKLLPEYLRVGTDYINFVRHQAKVDSLEFSEELCYEPGYAAVLLAKLGHLTHDPEQPEDMDDEFYKIARRGAMCAGQMDARDYLIRAINGQIADSYQEVNLLTMGHRDAVLNPKEYAVGFGAALLEDLLQFTVISYKSNLHNNKVNNGWKFYSWPASGNVMHTSFNNEMPWTVNLNSRYYKNMTTDDEVDGVTITLTNLSNGRQWIFDKNTSKTPVDGDGISGMYWSYDKFARAFVFRPDWTAYAEYEGDWNVRITGLYRRDNPTSGFYNYQPTIIDYNVHFFDFFDECEHVFEEIATNEPTCTTGTEHVYKCSVCGQIESQFDNDALGHDFIEEYISENSCDRQKRCLRCGFTEEIAGTHSYEEIAVTIPTCTEGTKHYLMCTKCGKETVITDDNALGHDLLEIETITATCTQGTGHVVVCQRCDYQDTVYDDDLAEHVFKETETVASTCQHGTRHTLQCVNCGIITTSEDNDKKEHTWVKDNISYENDVIVLYKCTTCGAEIEKKYCANDIFDDVRQPAWAHQGIDFMCYNGYMSGTDFKTFEPNTTTTRAMAVAVLMRIAGEKPVGTDNPFTDVPGGTWYSEPVQWAYENNVTSGTSETTFSPNKRITREEFVALIYRYVAPEYEYNEKTISGYADFKKVSEWARVSMAWAVENGLVSGTSPTTLSPQNKITRAEMATIMYRWLTSKE